MLRKKYGFVVCEKSPRRRRGSWQGINCATPLSDWDRAREDPFCDECVATVQANARGAVEGDIAAKCTMGIRYMTLWCARLLRVGGNTQHVHAPIDR